MNLEYNALLTRASAEFSVNKMRVRVWLNYLLCDFA